MLLSQYLGSHVHLGSSGSFLCCFHSILGAMFTLVQVVVSYAAFTVSWEPCSPLFKWKFLMLLSQYLGSHVHLGSSGSFVCCFHSILGAMFTLVQVVVSYAAFTVSWEPCSPLFKWKFLMLLSQYLGSHVQLGSSGSFFCCFHSILGAMFTLVQVVVSYADFTLSWKCEDTAMFTIVTNSCESTTN